jgi:glutathione synthase/RimK-type ligase-like ATP-grasp enzyme
LTNDTAIMDGTVEQLQSSGWRVTRLSEGDCEGNRLPAADLYLNMCQGAEASERLCDLEQAGALIVNSPRSVLSCHRHRMVKVMEGSGLRFPRTLIVPTQRTARHDREVAEFLVGREVAWMKRGDVHAERAEDVVRISPPEVSAALSRFRERGVRRVALQEHVAGPVVKFYGVGDGSFFRFYGAEAGPHGPVPAVDEERLKALAFAAAARLDLRVFGGDAVIVGPDRPVLIDVNDWPSFAPFRGEAAQAIARLAHETASARIAA